jgi:CSLREA domain-containing protein
LTKYDRQGREGRNMKKAKTNKVFYVVRMLFCAAAVLLMTQMAEAALFKVDSTEDFGDVDPGDGVCKALTGACTLRAAVQEANALAGADEIRLKAAVYRLTNTGADEDLAATGDLDITDSVTIKGKGDTMTVVDGHHSDRVFHVIGPGPVVSFVGMKIQNGTLVLRGVGGGGIYNEGAALIVNSCTITNNIIVGMCGGGVSSSHGSLKIVSSRVMQNELYGGVPALGGGICSIGDSSLKVVGTKVAHNFASVVIDDPVILNDGAWGGGICIVGTAAVKIKSSKILGNNVSNSGSTDETASVGAGVFMSGVNNADISDTKIANNSATGLRGGLGGGVFAVDSNVTFSGCTITENSSVGGIGGLGGGMYLQSEGGDPMTVTVYNLSNVTNNFASSGGGIYKNGPVALNISADAVVTGNLQNDIFP